MWWRRAVAGIVVGSALGWVSVAWACVPQAKLVSLEPRSFGAAGSGLTVSGLGFDETTVEIRWNGPEGPLLVKAQGPNFSVPVTVPDEPEGLYAIVVLNRQPGGGLGSASTAPFHVVAAGPERPPAAQPATTPGEGGPERSSSSIASPVALGLAGVALVALGAGAGIRFARRRPRTSEQTRS